MGPRNLHFSKLPARLPDDSNASSCNYQISRFLAACVQSLFPCSNIAFVEVLNPHLSRADLLDASGHGVGAQRVTGLNPYKRDDPEQIP